MSQTLSQQQATEPQQEIDEAFKSIILAMRSHHRAVNQYAVAFSRAYGENLQGDYIHHPPGFHLQFPRSFEQEIPTQLTGGRADGDPTQEMKDATTELQNKIQAIQQDSQNQATALVDEFKQNNDRNAFIQKMEAMKKQMKESVNDNIDKTFKTAEEVGTKFPQSQDFILNVAMKVSDFVNRVVTTIVNFFTNLINNIVQWVSQAVDKVKNFFSTAADSVGHFFATLF
ncbi:MULTISPECIES: hypothetical protein [Saccharothrix]|uniref:hypothetical protein n=1 Tax=Saccharothrix TaxID=2071 RepID=UPI00093BBAB8|nr:hypothetical protein [Saccharothrix sp. CB00851]OKI16239.1 hypothetical protein A6A25_13260 [Saccharothrix sp. CB00851]